MISCDDSNNTGNDAGALTEQDFFSDPDLMADPHEKVITINLEPSTAEEVDNLTGELGFDIIPFSYDSPVNQTFCWPDRGFENHHSMKLFDSDGVELTNIISNGECDTVMLIPGSYEMHLFHHDQSDPIDLIFIQPNIPSESLNVKHTGKLDILISKIIRFISILDTSQPSIAQLTPDQTKFINTRVCENCDLSNILLGGTDAPLEGCLDGVPSEQEVDITGSNVSGSFFNNNQWCSCGLGDLNGQGSMWIGGIYDLCTFNGSNFTDSTFDKVPFIANDFMGTNFSGSNINDSIFRNLRMGFDDQNNQTDFENATIDNTDFTLTVGFKDSNFFQTTITNSNLSGLDLRELFLLSDCDLTGSNLSNTDISDTVYSDVTFVNVNFTGANLSDFTCVNCTFTGANFTDANVAGINIDFTGAIWDDTGCVCIVSDCSNCRE